MSERGIASALGISVNDIELFPKYKDRHFYARNDSLKIEGHASNIQKM